MAVTFLKLGRYVDCLLSKAPAVHCKYIQLHQTLKSTCQCYCDKFIWQQRLYRALKQTLHFALENQSNKLVFNVVSEQHRFLNSKTNLFHCSSFRNQILKFKCQCHTNFLHKHILKMSPTNSFTLGNETLWLTKF